MMCYKQNVYKIKILNKGRNWMKTEPKEGDSWVISINTSVHSLPL